MDLAPVLQVSLENIANPNVNRFFGNNCTTKCHCESECFCHHITGKCHCNSKIEKLNCTTNDTNCGQQICSCPILAYNQSHEKCVCDYIDEPETNHPFTLSKILLATLILTLIITAAVVFILTFLLPFLLYFKKNKSNITIKSSNFVGYNLPENEKEYKLFGSKYVKRELSINNKQTISKATFENPEVPLHQRSKDEIPEFNVSSMESGVKSISQLSCNDNFDAEDEKIFNTKF
ncbi:hypothetical protein CEXT_812921 [Caerostris extrusa]|uniref:Uncharacterized protein n=1 Tax=Caerostris extrusa TaxID=172846 RepID=A0AAV4NF72_CAEEX|nr:hypothetical protein CEXT_812921 [Caerostris extrusa]